MGGGYEFKSSHSGPRPPDHEIMTITVWRRLNLPYLILGDLASDLQRAAHPPAPQHLYPDHRVIREAPTVPPDGNYVWGVFLHDCVPASASLTCAPPPVGLFVGTVECCDSIQVASSIHAGDILGNYVLASDGRSHNGRPVWLHGNMLLYCVCPSHLKHLPRHPWPPTAPPTHLHPRHAPPNRNLHAIALDPHTVSCNIISIISREPDSLPPSPPPVAH